MGWTVAGPAVEIHAPDLAGRVALQATSTATVRLGPADLDGGPARLRLYGVDDGAVTRSLPAARAWGRLLPENPCGVKERVVAFLDSRPALLSPFRFAIAPGAPLSPTCIPAHRKAVTWPVAAPGALRTLSLDVTYKDVSVLRLPDGAWLMLLARYRALTANPPRPRRRGAPSETSSPGARRTPRSRAISPAPTGSWTGGTPCRGSRGRRGSACPGPWSRGPGTS